MKDSLLSDVMGIRCRGMLNYKKSFITSSDNRILQGIDPRTHVMLRECYPERFDTVDDVQIIMLSELPATEVIMKERNFSYADDVAPGPKKEPFAVVHAYGEGKCVYFGGNIGKEYGVYGHPELKNAFACAVKLCAEPPIRTNAPSCVELAFYRKAGDHILHFMNYAIGQLKSTNRAGGYAAEQALPVHDINISMAWDKKPPVHVRLEDGTDIPYALEGGWLSFTVPKLEVHLLVIIG